MAYSDATRVDANTQRMTDDSSEQTDFRAAVKTFGDSVETVMSTYSLNDQDQQHVRDKIVDLCRFLDHCMQ